MPSGQPVANKRSERESVKITFDPIIYECISSYEENETSTCVPLAHIVTETEKCFNWS